MILISHFLGLYRYASGSILRNWHLIANVHLLGHLIPGLLVRFGVLVCFYALHVLLFRLNGFLFNFIDRHGFVGGVCFILSFLLYGLQLIFSFICKKILKFN